MIFDVIYDFYFSLFASENDISDFWSNWTCSFWDGQLGEYINYWGFDVLSTVASVITIIFGIFALFRILGGVLRLFRV